MKHPAGSAKPRRIQAPKTAPKKKVRLDLKRSPQPEPEQALEARQKSHFWKWVLLVALLHIVVISLVYWIYETASAAKLPPEQFVSLLPEGDVVKGTPGAQEAHKIGPTTPAPAVHHTSSATPPPAPPIQPPKPVQPKPTPPKPVVKIETPTPLADKPIAPPKPVPPKPPKVKVDLTLAEGPVPDKPVIKPKPHPKKPVVKTTDDSQDQDHEATTKPDSAGLSKEQIAAKLGEKLDAAGVKNATKTGTSGSTNTRQNEFSAYYLMIAQQINDQWQIPNVAAGMTSNPIVHIHVEKDGRVPPESVYLIQSSGNSAYDDSAISTAKNFGYLREPLPDGCPPDISINFKPER